jgi:large subunit ribosomal protein L23
MIKLTDVLIQPIQTEKTQSQSGKYTFLVHPKATKTQIKAAVLEFYGVEVLSVNMINLPEKMRIIGRGITATKRKSLRKAVVTLAEGKTIDFNAIK